MSLRHTALYVPAAVGGGVTVILTGQASTAERGTVTALTPSAAITGTATASITETDITDGGKIIFIDLTDDTWVSAGATFNAQRQAIINGLDSSTFQPAGWNAEVQANEVVTAVVRTSSTRCTITLSPHGSYNIVSQEEITVTIPAAALVTSTSAVIATPDPAFTVDEVATPTVVILTGQEAAAQRGTLTPIGASNITLVGLENDAFQGNLTPIGASVLTLTGQEAVAERGNLSLSIDVTVELTGLASTSLQGTLTPVGDALITLSGQESTAERGTLSVDVGDVVVILTGQESTAQRGNLTITGEALVELTGQASAAAQGHIGFPGDIKARTMTDWIMQQPTLTGTAPDRWDQFLTMQGFIEGTIVKRLYDWFGSEGYTSKNMNQRKKDWEAFNLTLA